MGGTAQIKKVIAETGDFTTKERNIWNYYKTFIQGDITDSFIKHVCTLF